MEPEMLPAILSVMMSMDRLCLKDLNERMTDVKQILSDKTEKVLEEPQVTGQENDLEKDTLMAMQK